LATVLEYVFTAQYVKHFCIFTLPYIFWALLLNFSEIHTKSNLCYICSPQLLYLFILCLYTGNISQGQVNFFELLRGIFYMTVIKYGKNGDEIIQIVIQDPLPGEKTRQLSVLT